MNQPAAKPEESASKINSQLSITYKLSWSSIVAAVGLENFDDASGPSTSWPAVLAGSLRKLQPPIGEGYAAAPSTGIFHMPCNAVATAKINKLFVLSTMPFVSEGKEA